MHASSLKMAQLSLIRVKLRVGVRALGVVDWRPANSPGPFSVPIYSRGLASLAPAGIGR